ncbi:hypothetical protein AMAG_07227 [Allomyces macrogynus ATCC 38327]|uniref:Ubiquitin-like protease family profile domain-containing protein n=1 Tax=Allomyces macrogynus (strain ATCC 38327) TaxID=578462 RepID=A0A0L0SHK2_ALLM3|nr:hypothetical protein AMAG_07227 [Allomyces macrogynus ATCC 38327]|eukprot:KNE61961.1 hypothetical protein AMAG_07227 [Allomyces macrogynus ATCC 38327]
MTTNFAEYDQLKAAALANQSMTQQQLDQLDAHLRGLDLTPQCIQADQLPTFRPGWLDAAMQNPEYVALLARAESAATSSSSAPVAASPMDVDQPLPPPLDVPVSQNVVLTLTPALDRPDTPRLPAASETAPAPPRVSKAKRLPSDVNLGPKSTKRVKTGKAGNAAKNDASGATASNSVESASSLADPVEAAYQSIFQDPEKEPVVSVHHLETLTRKDLRCLRDKGWLGDQVINGYGRMLADHCRKSGGALPNIHFFDSFFYQHICAYGHKQVARWTKRFDLFALDLLLFPVHLSQHWCLGCVNFRRKRIEYYDSLHGPVGPYFAKVRKYLDAEHRTKKGGAPFDFDGWTDYYPTAPGHEQIPRQTNGYDCGVFTCAFMHHVVNQGAEWQFKQEDMAAWRRRIVHEFVEYGRECKLAQSQSRRQQRQQGSQSA